MPLLNAKIWYGASNQAVAPGIIRPLHATGNIISLLLLWYLVILYANPVISFSEKWRSNFSPYTP